MKRPRLLHLATAATLAAGLCAPALAQSDRNGRLLPPSASSAKTAPPPVQAPPPAEVPASMQALPAVTATTPAGSPLATGSVAAETVPAATAGPTVLPGAAASVLSNEAQVPGATGRVVGGAATPIAAVPAVSIPAPRTAPSAGLAAASTPATGLSPTAPSVPAVVEPALPAVGQPSATAAVRIRVRTPLPAVRAAAAVSLTQDAAAEMPSDTAAQAEAALTIADVLATETTDTKAQPTESIEVAESIDVTSETVVAPSPTMEVTADILAREAEAMRTAAEQERAAVTQQPASPLPAPSIDGSAGAAATDANDTTPTPAVDQATAPTPSDAAPPVASPQPIIEAEAATAEAARDERRGGIRWIAGAGLPPPEAVILQDKLVPARSAMQELEATADAEVPEVTGRATADAPRVRRRPTTAPIAAPFQLVRTLQAMQDDMAGGSAAALNGQRALLQRMEEEFADADPLVWQDRRNARALVAYTLGGGRPVTLRRLLASATPPDGDEALMRGALAFVEGDEATARRYLTDIDPRSLPASLGGQLALAQAALLVGQNPQGALLLLDTARLLAPGTLVEEAALRRQIFVASELDDLARFETLSGQYLRRFRRSVYAGNFRRRFAAALSRMKFLDDPAQFYRLDDMLAETDAEARRELYLVVAEAAVNEGKTTLAATAAERALASAPPGSVDEARGRLYRGAALAVTRDGLEVAMADLRTVRPSGLPRTDAALLRAASETAELIQTAAATEGVNDGPTAANAEEEKPSPTVSRARDAIAAVDALLEQAR
jgi:chemotaxis protein MotC